MGPYQSAAIAYYGYTQGYPLVLLTPPNGQLSKKHILESEQPGLRRSCPGAQLLGQHTRFTALGRTSSRSAHEIKHNGTRQPIRDGWGRGAYCGQVFRRPARRACVRGCRPPVALGSSRWSPDHPRPQSCVALPRPAMPLMPCLPLPAGAICSATSAALSPRSRLDAAPLR